MSKKKNSNSKLFVTMSGRLDRLRKELKLTWGEFEEHLGISHTMMHFMRSGERTPSMKLLRRIEAEENKAGIEPRQKKQLEYDHSEQERENSVVKESSEILTLISRVEAVELELSTIKHGLIKIIGGR